MERNQTHSIYLLFYIVKALCAHAEFCAQKTHAPASLPVDVVFATPTLHKPPRNTFLPFYYNRIIIKKQ